MKYTFDSKVPYEFKDITGLADEDKVGISLLEDGKIIGGIVYQKDNFPMQGQVFKFFSIVGIELLPEHRNKGKGTSFIKELLTKYDYIHAGVQDEKAWAWWKKMGSEFYLAISLPEDRGKVNPRIHTLYFVLGRDPKKTHTIKQMLHNATSGMPGVEQTTTPNIDFSVNK